MREYLRTYQVVMRTVGPVFVGSGKDIKKKEYVWMGDRNQVGIPDMQKLYREVVKRKKQSAFEEYFLGFSNKNLTDWLVAQNFGTGRELRPFLKYALDYDDGIRDRRRRNEIKELEVKECVKDAYGNPYIPGSTLKGMLRTILLGADILDHPEKYEGVRDRLKANADRNAKRNLYLKDDTQKIEQIFYRVLEKDPKNPGSAVNDALQGLVVSDSAPLPVNRLALCQKVDLFIDGKERYIPILRECIKPGTDITFTVTVDTSVCDVTKESFYAAMKTFITCYYNRFSAKFKQWIEVPNVRQVFCGGGCGFVSKTIIYPMYGKQERVEMAQKIFEKTKVPAEHKHCLDSKIGISPHTLKCTVYQGKRYQMGLCTILGMDPI